MATTSNGVYYPVLGDAPNGPSQMQQLAQSVDHKIIGNFATAAARSAAITAPSVGDLTYRADADVFEKWTGTAWRIPIGRIAGSSFGTDIASSGATEVAGYSQAVALNNGARYRIYFKGYMNGGAANNIGGVNLRYSTAALSTSSTLAGTMGAINHATAGSTGRGHLCFFEEFIAPSTATYNIGAGVLSYVGTGNETVLGSVLATEITIDQVG